MTVAAAHTSRFSQRQRQPNMAANMVITNRDRPEVPNCEVRHPGNAGAVPRIGVISDTHGLLRPQVEQRLAGVAHIVHAGDVGSPKVIAGLYPDDNCRLPSTDVGRADQT